MIPDISNVPMSKFNKDGLIYAPIVLGNERDIGRRKIAEAEHYIESAPEIPGGYIDLAIAYADLEKYPQAIEALRKALELAKSDDDRYLIYFNIAVIYLNTNKLEEAQKYIDLAKQLTTMMILQNFRAILTMRVRLKRNLLKLICQISCQS